MKINSKKRFFTSVIATSLAVATVAAGTAFYIQGSAAGGSSDNYSISIYLTETGENGNLLSTQNGDVTNNIFSIVPATSQDKNPTVHVKTTTKAFVFMEVKDNTKDLVKYTPVDGWKKLEGVGSGFDVYYTTVSKNDDYVELPFINEVKYDSGITNEKLLDYSNEDISLTFSAKAIEANVFAGHGEENEQAAYAYEHFEDEPEVISKYSQLLEAINTAESGSEVYVSFNDDLTISNSKINLTDDSYNNETKSLVIEGNGKTLTSSLSGVITLSDGNARTLTLSNLNIESKYSGDSSTPRIISIHTENNSNIIIDNCNLSWTNRTDYNQQTITLAGYNCSLYIKGFTNVTVKKGYAIYVSSGNRNNTFIVDEDMTGIINGGIYVGSGNSALIIKGGTFKNTGLTIDQFKQYVPDGYEVKVNSDNSWTVTKSSN